MSAIHAAGSDPKGGTGTSQEPLERATFAGGCFWCMEPPYDKLDGVISTTPGYTGGDEKNPTYEMVSSGRTGHLEAVQVLYNPSRVSYEQLLEVFWKNIDPTQTEGQFADIGPQYRTAVFYHNEEQRIMAEHSKKRIEASGKFGKKKIVTLILPAREFYPAEEYHQDYYRKEPFRYKSYRWGSGRERFLQEKWEKE